MERRKGEGAGQNRSRLVALLQLLLQTTIRSRQPFRMAAPAPDHTRSLEDDVPIPASDALRRRIEAEMDEDDADDALLELSEPPPPASASFRTQS